MKKLMLKIALVTFLFGAAQTQAQDAGSVTFATGEVTAERQPAAALVKGDTVFASDAIITGPASRAQLRMSDGAKIAIRPDSRIVIDEYVYAAAAAGSAVSTTQDSSVISLVKGGFRSITGAIGKDNPQNVEVRTAVGVLGIRGTNFAVLLCGSCDAAPGVAPGTTVPQGLYIMVTDGVVVFRNEVDELELTAGEFAFIPFSTRQPTRVDSTPPVFIDDSDFRFEADDQARTGFDSKLGLRREVDPNAPSPGSDTAGPESKDDGSSAAPAQPVIGIDEAGNPVDLTPGAPPDQRNRSITYSTGPLGAANAIFSGVLDNSSTQVQLDRSGNPTGFDNLYPLTNSTDIASFQIGGSGSVDTGFDALTVMRWGRWAGGSTTIILSDGSNANQDLNNQSLHWVASADWTTPVIIPVTGVADYSLLGATSPTDNLGNTGTVRNANFTADFTNMRVTSSLMLDVNGSTWTADGTGNLGTSALFQGNYGAVSIDGIGGGNGVFSGFFAEPGPSSDPTFPGGVGLTYSLQDMTGSVSVSGAAAFGNP